MKLKYCKWVVTPAVGRQVTVKADEVTVVGKQHEFYWCGDLVAVFDVVHSYRIARRWE